MRSARRIHQIDGNFNMRYGQLLNPSIAYETWGELNARKDNGILIFTGLSPSAHAASSMADPSPGWWEQLLGPGKAIDTHQYFVICVASLGSCFGSTGPASIDPLSKAPYGLSFPRLSIEDIAQAGHTLVEALGLSRLHAVLGASMGGMTSLAYSILHPQVAENLVTISGSAQAAPFAIALRSLQREIITRDPAWKNGKYKKGEEPIIGMQLARKLGMLTYRSAAELEQRFGREMISAERLTGAPFDRDFEVESYLEAQSGKFVRGFDANCYLYLSRAMDLFDLAEHGGSVEVGLSRVGASRVLVIGIQTDLLFPLAQQQLIADCLSNAPEREVVFFGFPSLQGHDAFLVDMDRFQPAIRDFFAPEEEP